MTTDEQPGHYTAIDMARDLVHVGFISVGCYCGWQVRATFPALFAGGVVGRMVGVLVHVSLLRLLSWRGGRAPGE